MFGTQWATESIDVALRLDGEQDALIEAVAIANPNTVVVLQTGGPVLMPWADRVPAIVAAWYPGRMGGAAIARVLTGAVNPSGHLPAPFPRSLDQLPYPGEPRTGDLAYDEGATVGFKWFDARGHAQLFPFGHGLVASVSVTNTGARAGADAVQLYVSGPGWDEPRRLAGFAKVALEAGESTVIGIEVDPRLLAVWDTANPGWTRKAGPFVLGVAHSSREVAESETVELPVLHLPPEWRPQ